MTTLSAQDNAKQAVAQAALKFIEPGEIIGVGSGSTVNFFIDALANADIKIKGAVASSEQTAQRLRAADIEVLDLNSVGTLSVYVDGADEFDPNHNLIKGGGAALTREKIIAACSRTFICIVDHSKQVDVLGEFPLPIEVIPMARSYVARQIVALGGDPVYRSGVVTDNGNQILDVHHLKIAQPNQLQQQFNQIVGVVTVGLFASRGADRVLLATVDGKVKEFVSKR